MPRLSTALMLAGLVLADTSAWTNSAPICIGVNFERIGSISFYGQHALVSAQAAAEEINNTGGINVSLIELVIKDNKSSPRQVVIATRILAGNEDGAG